ncbi:MAG TPA: type II secretion system protein GspL [Burkholderiales bacterium]|nr:type II secretion system protein GspL [Burkholderiales bacterium]
MKQLRIYCPLQQVPSQCKWALVDSKGQTTTGTSPIKDLPRRVDRVQLVIPASEILITRARIPASAAQRGGGAVLAFALEEQTATDPDANIVSWLGKSGDMSVLAAIDRRGLDRWRDALRQAGIQSFEIHSEMLWLPRASDEWSISWNGFEGFVRTGPFEAATTDSGSEKAAPLSLHLLLDQARSNGHPPRGLALYTTADDAIPDLEAWGKDLDIPVRHAGAWTWHSGASGEGIALAQEARRWGSVATAIPKLRLAGWMLALALVVHAVALVVDWTLLANEQRTLRRQMESRFRSAFPDTVAVVDPLLQMRRKLAEVRHNAGQPDAGDFLPMTAKVALATKELPPGTVRILSYEGGRATFDLMTVDTGSLDRAISRLREAGFGVEKSPSPAGAGRAVVTVRVP